jgi:hypothetical protein
MQATYTPDGMAIIAIKPHVNLGSQNSAKEQTFAFSSTAISLAWLCYASWNDTEAVRIDQLERIFNPSVFEDKIGTHIDIYHEMHQSVNKFAREPRIRLT